MRYKDPKPSALIAAISLLFHWIPAEIASASDTLFDAGFELDATSLMLPGSALPGRTVSLKAGVQCG